MSNNFKCEMCNFETNNEETLMEHLFYEGEYNNE